MTFMKTHRHIYFVAVSLLAAVSAASTTTVVDPMGDTFGTGPVQIDIRTIDASFDSSNVNFTITFVGAIAPPSAGLSNSLSALVDIHTDQRADTGTYALTQMFSPPPALVLGAEVIVDVASEESHPGRIDILNAGAGNVLGTVPIDFRTNSVSFAIPLAF